MGFLSFIVLLAIAYLVWRVTDQLPDLIFRLSEIQRDVAEVRRRLAEQEAAQPAPARADDPAPVPPGAGSGGSHTSGPVGDETGADYSG